MTYLATTDAQPHFHGSEMLIVHDMFRREFALMPGLVRGVAVGDRVIVKMRHGAYCDEAVAAPTQLVKLPSNFDYAEGATFLAGHGTAYHALIDRGQVQPGQEETAGRRRHGLDAIAGVERGLAGEGAGQRQGAADHNQPRRRMI